MRASLTSTARRLPAKAPAPAAVSLLAAVLVLATPTRAGAQDTPGGNMTSTGEDTLRAHRMTAEAADAFVLDGLLAEGFWSEARAVTGFRQREPDEGAAATERTEVRIAYDEETLYVGVVAHDSEPERVVARILQRDRIMEQGFFGGGGPAFTGDDGIAILLDPFHDHRNAMVFATNPHGAQFDALMTDEGAETNIDWRAVWEVAARRTEEGWSAELAIPFRTLRYPDAVDGRPWGFNVFRMIQRKKEEVLWRSWGREGEGFHRVSRAGHLTGLTDLPRTGLNVEAKPFVLGRTTRMRDDEGELPRDNELDVGLDLKSELRPGLLLDLTLNTDFAQVEVDDQQVNLTRFDLFFPEKRDFFLENAGIFQFGADAPGGFGTPPFLMFFSRRIGIAPEGEVPLLGGARLTGRVGAQTVGVLSAVTDDAFGRAGEVFNVARLKRDVGESNYLGAMVADRRGADSANTAVGVDGQLYLHPTLRMDAFYARTFTDGPGGDDDAYRVSLDFTTDRVGGFFQHLMVGPEAVARSGFVTRTDIRQTELFGRFRLRPDRMDLRFVDLRANSSWQTTVDGRFQDWSAGLTLAPNWNAGDNLDVGVTWGETQVDADFPLADTITVPAGRYSTTNATLRAGTSSARAWSLSGNVRVADFFGGELVSVGGEVSLTPSPRFSLTGGFTRNDVEVPGGDFTADISRLRASLALSTRLTADALVQHNSLDNTLSTNVRLNFIHRPGSDLFLVLTEERGTRERLWDLVDRGLVLKLTYLKRF